MKSRTLKIILGIIIAVLCIVTSIIIVYISNTNKEKQYFKFVYEFCTTTSNNNDIKNAVLIDSSTNVTIIGTLEIPKINFQGVIAESTDLPILKNYLGHFESTPVIKGNVGIAGHNTTRFFGNLNKLVNGDEIIYNTAFGTKLYKVFNITVIEETDWTVLKDTDINMLTLITCVRNKPNLRLCIQAVEI